MNELSCNDVESNLQDFVDGLLGSAAERRMREHLAACARCQRGERELRRLLTRVAELPRSLPPAHDLWPGVAARLGERSRRPRAASSPWRRRTPRQWALQSAAAVFFMVCGAALPQFFRSPAGDAPPGGGPPATLAAEGARAADFATLEADFLRAKEALWLAAYSRHEDLSPVAVEIVQRNLVIIDKAIRELHEALDADPGNPYLEDRLLAHHRRGIDLLRQLAGRRDRT